MLVTPPATMSWAKFRPRSRVSRNSFESGGRVARICGRVPDLFRGRLARGGGGFAEGRLAGRARLQDFGRDRSRAAVRAARGRSRDARLGGTLGRAGARGSPRARGRERAGARGP